MDVIVSHNNTDLDGLASMIAAKKLYPEAELVLAGKLHRNVKEFMALHKDEFAFKKPKDINLEEVTKLILVDTKSPLRIGEMRFVLDNPNLQVHIFDHHPRTADDLHGDYVVLDCVGAATTLLVEEIRRHGCVVNPLEATVLAMGIYEDTGSLTFSTTTPRDAAAVAFLLAQGVNLSVVADFIDRPLSEQQKNLFNALIASAEIEDINGNKILVAVGETEDYIGGLALLVHKLMDVVNPDAAIAVVMMDDRLHLVARSQNDTLNAARVLAEFNGGGHAAAASAVVRERSVHDVVGELKELLRRNVQPELTAQRIMSSPVKSVPQNTTIDEASLILLRYGHSGLPVVDGERTVGIISRRDIDKAKHHGLGHAPVKGFMSRNVVAVAGGTTLSVLQHLMIENDIGRLPVIEGEKLVGIVSRTDILKNLHGDNYSKKFTKVYHAARAAEESSKNVSALITHSLSLQLRELLTQVGRLADREGLAVFAVGGFVRDLLLGVENYDVDLVVEGDAPEFARRLADILDGRVIIHQKFGTAMVILPDKLRIDVATARTEYYEYPAALPTVEVSSLKQDLYRRDFTINSIALTLSEKNFGGLIDYFGGRRDLENKVIRVLYNLSFVEDPTRILRAVRFEQRYNFIIEKQTLYLMQKAIKSRMPAKLSAGRVREELKHILGEPDPVPAILRMQELDIWPIVFPEAGFDGETAFFLRRIPAAAVYIKEASGADLNLWIVYLGVLVRNTGCRVAAVDARLRLTREEQKKMGELLCTCPEAVNALSVPASMKISEIAAVVRNISLEGWTYILATTSGNAAGERLKDYLACIQHNKLRLTGDDLIQMGFKPGPRFKEALDAAQDAKLDGLLKTREEELSFIKDFLTDRELSERG